MFGRYLLSLIVSVLGASGLVAQDANSTDKEKLQGAWVMFSSENPDKKLKEDEVKKSKLLVKGDEWLATNEEGLNRKFTFKIDSTTSPKRITLTAESKGKEATWRGNWRGIYKLDGDTLTICRTQGPNEIEPPMEFKTGERVVLTVYKRSKE